MAIIIKPKRSGSSDSVPTTGDLADGEIAINTADQKIYARSSSSIVNLGTGTTASAAELNIMDGGTSATSTTVADADRVVLNDNGTMIQVAVTDLAAYFDDEITAMPNLVTTAATTVGALNSGSITSGFGTIDTGSSTITTTGLISGGSLDIDDVLINGTTIGHTDDTDLMTVADGLLTIAGEISVTTLDIGGTNVTSTATELNLLDGSTAGSVVNSKAVVYSGAGAIAGTLSTAAQGNITSLGTLTTLTVDNVAINGATIGHTGDTDLMTLASGILTVAGEISATTLDIGGTNVTSTAAELNKLDGMSGTAVGTTDTQTLTNKTLTSPAINTGVSGSAVLDEDDMASDSASKIATQQSVKAYTDAASTAMAIALG